MNRIVNPAGILAAGLGLSQAVFWVLVYQSNIALHEKVAALGNAGYLVVPGAHVFPTLTQLSPAFYGALFFTFTTGAGLTLPAMAGAWVYRRLFRSSGYFMVLLLLAWLLAIVWVNINGFTHIGTISLAVIPPIVFAFAIFRMPSGRLPRDRLVIALYIAAIAVIAIAWLPKTDRGVFIDIRDHLLLSHAPGIAINDFYYNYTLYPAKLLKPPGKTLMTPACTEGVKGAPLRRRIDETLARQDFLSVAPNGPCDLYVSGDNQRIYFSKNGKRVLDTPPENFFGDPGGVLAEFTEGADNLRFFRMITFVSLFTALPLALFILGHTLFAVLVFMIPPVLPRHAAALLLCVLVGAGAAVPLYTAREGPVDTAEAIQDDLSSHSWQKQRNALMSIRSRSMDPLRFESSRRLSASPRIPVRYWYAAALGGSRNPSAYDILLEMTKDPSPNVRCMAYSGLGRIDPEQARGAIRNRISAIDHWYVQWYAYKSLRQTGWTQKRSDTHPALLP